MSNLVRMIPSSTPGFSFQKTTDLKRCPSSNGCGSDGYLSLLPRITTPTAYIGTGRLQRCYPSQPPGGSFVKWTNRKTKSSRNVAVEFEGHIYFVEMRDGYTCAGAPSNASRCFLPPHPLASSPVPRPSTARGGGARPSRRRR